MEGLIQTSGAKAPRSVAAGGALFLAITAGTGAVEFLSPAEPLELAGEERREALAAQRERSFWDGSLARSYETTFRLHGRVRRWLAPYWSAALLHLGDVPSRDLIVGRDGWLFLRDRVRLPQRASNIGGRHLANLFGLVSRSLGSRGTTLLCLPIPRKSRMCQTRLPLGIDCDPGFDEAVVESLRARGTRTVDIGPVWDGHAPEEIYLKYDSHWAVPARRMLAQEVQRALPELGRDSTPYSLVEGPTETASDGLRFAGVDSDHPAHRTFDALPAPRLSLRPRGIEGRIDRREMPSDVLLVGTSFCELFHFRAYLCATLQTAVEDASELGRMPLLSLEKALMTRPLALPSFVITEFPMHHAGMIHRASVPTVRAALGIARQLGFAARAQALPLELFQGETQTAAGASFPPGSLLSSGDGVLGIELTFDGSEASKWRFETSGSDVVIGAKPGRRTRRLPILEEGTVGGHYLHVTAKGASSAETQVAARVVTDADVAGGDPLAGTSSDDGLWSAETQRSIQSRDSLALSWDKPTSGPVVLVAQGQDRKGAATEQAWTFENARRARFVIVTLGLFEGGQLKRVTLRGASSSVHGVIAHQVKAL